MDSNDFIFTDDAAESLGVRTAEADQPSTGSGESESAIGSGKARLAALGGLGLGILSLMSFLDRSTHL